MISRFIPSKWRRVIAVDLGTVNSVIAMDENHVDSQPTMLAYNKATKEWSYGKAAAAEERLHSDNIEIIKPMQDGKITDIEHVEALLCYFMGQTCPAWSKYYAKYLKLRKLSATGIAEDMKKIQEATALFVIAIPCELTDPNINAVKSIGSRLAQKCALVLQPVASAYNEIDFKKHPVVKIVDIGGGTTDLAAACENGVIGKTKSISVAGNAMDQSIQAHVKKIEHVTISEYRARMIKHAVGAARITGEPKVVEFEGRDSTGKKKSISYSSENSVDALNPCIRQILQASFDFMANLAQERPDATTFTSKLGEDGSVKESDILFLTGGQSQLDKLDEVFREEHGVEVVPAQNPLGSAALGTLKLAQDEKQLKNFEVVSCSNGVNSKIEKAEEAFERMRGKTNVVSIDSNRSRSSVA